VLKGGALLENSNNDDPMFANSMCRPHVKVDDYAMTVTISRRWLIVVSVLLVVRMLWTLLLLVIAAEQRKHRTKVYDC